MFFRNRRIRAAIYLTLAVCLVLAACAATAGNPVRQDKKVQWTYEEKVNEFIVYEEFVIDGSTIKCLAILGTYRGALSCNW